MLSENNRPISVDQRRFRTQIPEELHSVFGILKVVLWFFFFSGALAAIMRGILSAIMLQFLMSIIYHHLLLHSEP